MAASRTRAVTRQIEMPSHMGRDEMNLAEFPSALITDRASEGVKTLYFESKQGRLTITGSDAHGLPTASDADVIIALIYLTKLRNNFTDVKVNFSKYELIKILHWNDEGRSYKRLDKSLNRWHGVSLLYDGCWWNNRLKCYTDMKIHIIEEVEIVKSDARRKASASGQTELPLSSFEWNKKFIESCQADNLRQLNLDEYFSLKSAIAKQLYRFLGKRFYHQDEWIFDLNEIAFDRVGLSRNYADAYKIREKLQPAIEELEAIGFLHPFSRDERYSRIDWGQWTIRLARHRPALVAVQPAAAPKPLLVAELTRRGVSGKAAADLVQNHLAEAIQLKIEVFDWLVARQDKRVAKSPEGYLVKSISDNYRTPKGFVSKAEAAALAETKRLAEQKAAEERRRQQEIDQNERRLADQVKFYRQSRTPEQLAQLEADAVAQASEETRQSLDSPAMKRFRSTQVLMLVNEHIARLIEAGQLAVEPA